MTPELPLLPLLVPWATIAPPGRLIWEGPHEYAKDARERHFEVSQGKIILAQWRGKVHEIIYQMPLDLGRASRRRNRILFDHYGQGHAWKEVLDNGFGKSYWRADRKRFALWSYAMDFNTFMTSAFHRVAWG